MYIFDAVEGEPYGEKTNFRKKVSQCRKTERGDRLGVLNTKSVVKIKEIEGGPFGEKIILEKKSHNAEKLKGIFQHPDAKQQKIKWGNLRGKNFSEKKSHSAEKKIERGDPLISPSMVCYAEKQEKPFLVQFARPNGAIWCNNVL